jgi:hypothetical protein
MHLLEVKNPLLEVIKHTDLPGMEEVGLREVAHYTRNMSNDVDSLANKARRELGIGCLGDGIAERST